jgi:hypothetical protein
MAESLLVRKGGGGAKIEEAVQNFNVASGQTILPGTFVSFVDNILNQNGITFQSNLSDDLNIVKLSDTKVVVVFRHQGDNNTPKAFVVDINGNTMTAGTFYTIVAGDAYSVRAKNIDGTRFVTTYWKSSQGAIRIGSVSGTVITFGTATNYEGNSIGDPVPLDGTRIFIPYRNQSFSNLAYSRVISISGTTITSVGASQVPFPQTGGNSTVANFIRAELIQTNKVIIAYKNETSNTSGGGRSYALVATISGTTITYDSNQIVNNDPETDTIFPVVLTPSKIAFVTYYSSTNNPNFANQGKVIIGKFNQGLGFLYVRFGGVFTTSAFNTFQSAVRLNDNEFLITSGDAYSHLGTGTVAPQFSISLNVVGAYETGRVKGVYATEWIDVVIRNQMFITLPDALTSSFIPAVLLGNNKVMLGYRHQNTGAGNLVIANLNKLITNTTAANPSKIFGLAKTGGTAGETIEVYVNE